MGKIVVRNAAIRGVVASVPENRVPLDTDHCPFAQEDIDKIRSMTGIQSRAVIPEGACVSDLMTDAARGLLEKLNWDLNSVDLLVVVTQSGDYILPATSCVIQKNLGLSKSCLAFDVGLGCSGYVYGLAIVGSLLSSGSIRRALLLSGDSSSRMAAPTDRSTALLFGDVGTATAIEYTAKDDGKVWSFVGGTDGEGYRNLIIPAGGTRHPIHASGAQSTDADYVQPSPHLFMDGGEIFKFTIEVVPTLLKDTLAIAQTTIDQVDYFILHQANMFLLKHLAKKMKIPSDKMPTTLADFGNTSSSSIPLTLIHGVGEKLVHSAFSLVMAGFGVGYSWGAIHLHIDSPMYSNIRDFRI